MTLKYPGDERYSLPVQVSVKQVPPVGAEVTVLGWRFVVESLCMHVPDAATGTFWTVGLRALGDS